MAMSQRNREKIAKLIAERKDFTHGNMSGKWFGETDYIYFGQLYHHPEVIAEIKKLHQDRDVYLVFSYSTPIAYAWDKTITVPDTRFSVTTSHHQSITRSAQRS